MRSEKQCTTDQNVKRFLTARKLASYIAMIVVWPVCAFVLYTAATAGHNLLQRSTKWHADSLEIAYDIVHNGMEVTTSTASYLSKSSIPIKESSVSNYIDGRAVLKMQNFSIQHFATDTATAFASVSIEAMHTSKDTVTITKRYGIIHYSKMLNTWRRV